jgi:CubicO group peptidase (beta-lactamase class C family)
LARELTAFVLAASCTVFLLNPARADIPQPRAPAAAIDKAIEEIVTRFRITGLAVGVVQNGSPIYARGFGVRDSRTSAPITPHTQFHAASISKTLTATAILQLVEQGKLAINDPVERYLPAFSGSGITLAELLTHSAGLSDWSHATHTADDAAVARYVSDVARHERAYAPGQGWEYSDADFNILGAVVEAASGISYPDYMQRYVLDVAGMTESTFRRPQESGDLAWPHLGEYFVRRASDHPWDRVFLPSSGLQTSVTDLMRWAAINLDRQPAVLSASSYEALFTRRVDTVWSGVAMGLGWQLEKRGSRWLPRHPGGDPGFRALLTLYPDAHRAIVILSNSETTPRFEIRHVIEAALDGKPIVLPEPPVLVRYRWLICFAAMALAIAGGIALWRRRLRSV